MKDYYAILGVRPSCHSAEIKRAYRRLALQYHPDRNSSPEAQQVFVEITEAYDTLSDEESRRWYDYKIQNNFDTEVITEPPPEPAHRDPAYRRRTQQTPPTTSAAKERLAMINKCLPYVSWTVKAGLIMMLVFTLDYSLPLIHSTETVTESYYVKVKGTGSLVVKTTGWHFARVYDYSFSEGDTVDIAYTPILRTVFDLSIHGKPEKAAHPRGMYGNIIILPLFLFGTSIAGYIMRRKTETYFNICIMNAVLLLIVVYFALKG